jgi:hypothetical protein
MIYNRNAKRDPSEYCGDYHEQLDASDGQFEHRLLLSFRQRVKVFSQAALPRKCEEYRMREPTKLEKSVIFFKLT